MFEILTNRYLTTSLILSNWPLVKTHQLDDGFDEHELNKKFDELEKMKNK